MSSLKRRLEALIKDGAQPELGNDGLPFCSEGRCQQYDGKRCELLAARPDRFCEPALIDIVGALSKLFDAAEAVQSVLGNKKDPG